MKRTALYDKHLALGAKMVPYAGYEMPVQYSGVKAEHLAVRQNVGMFDVSHMGEFVIRGPKALDLIQYATSNDAAKLIPGKVQYSCFPNRQNGIVDDLLVYHLAENEYLLVVNASNMGKDWAWLNELNEVFKAEIEDISMNTSLMAVQGPKAADCLQSLTDMDLKAMKYYTCARGSFAGCQDVLVSATGYTGAGGFEIYCTNEQAAQIWDAIMEAGKAFDLQAAGLAARDTLRLEMGFCLYGNDINEHTSPNEAGLGWITKYTKVFVNSENLRIEKEIGASRKLVGFEMIEKGIPRKDYKIQNEAGEDIGIVTSGTMSPSLDKAIGLGYVQSEFAKEGNHIYIEVRNKQIKAEIVKLPFYKG